MHSKKLSYYIDFNKNTMIFSLKQLILAKIVKSFKFHNSTNTYYYVKHSKHLMTEGKVNNC